jgi:hypothetical protein
MGAAELLVEEIGDGLLAIGDGFKAGDRLFSCVKEIFRQKNGV